jgi:NADH:ubiquinone oxidoreductase subunit 6 (subunit J)
MAPFIVLALVFALAVFALVVFVAVVLGIHSERHQRRLTTKAQGPVGAMVRRLLGVYVGKPNDAITDDREECLTGQSTDWWNKGGGNR